MAPGGCRASLVRPQDIKTGALLTIEGELDDISGAGQTRAAHELCTGIPKSRQFHYDAIGAGHYGIFSGRRWREKIYPTVRDFIAKPSGCRRGTKSGRHEDARQARRQDVGTWQEGRARPPLMELR